MDLNLSECQSPLRHGENQTPLLLDWHLPREKKYKGQEEGIGNKMLQKTEQGMTKEQFKEDQSRAAWMI